MYVHFTAMVLASVTTRNFLFNHENIFPGLQIYWLSKTITFFFSRQAVLSSIYNLGYTYFYAILYIPGNFHKTRKNNTLSNSLALLEDP